MFVCVCVAGFSFRDMRVSENWGVPFFWSPYIKDPTIWGTILGCPIFGNSHIGNQVQGFGLPSGRANSKFISGSDTGVTIDLLTFVLIALEQVLSARGVAHVVQALFCSWLLSW